jgi:cryptochrome 1
MQVSDHEIKQALNSKGIQYQCFNADLLYEPYEVVDAQGQPFTTLDDFWNK